MAFWGASVATEARLVSLAGPASTVVLCAFLVAVMISIGLEVTLGECISVLRNRRLLLSALAANFIIVPLLGLGIATLLPMPTGIETGFLLLAAAPGGMFAINFTRQMRGSVPIAASLLFVLTVLPIVLTPSVAQLLLRIYPHVTVHYEDSFRVVLLYIIVPLGIGLVIHRWSPRIAQRLQKSASVGATVLFVLGVVLTFSVKSAATRRITINGLLAMLLLIVGSMAVGWLMGGPDEGSRRVLAINSSMRNVALCLAIASRCFSNTDVEVAVIAFSALMVPPSMLFTVFESRKLKKQVALASQSSAATKDAA